MATGASAASDVSAVERDAVEGKLPVGLVCQGDVGNGPSEVGRVHAPENKLALRLVPVDVEGEDGRIHDALVDHVVEDRNNAVDGDAGEGEAEDAVKLCRNEGDSRLVCHLGKRLPLHLDVAPRERVLGEESSAGARAVLDRKLCSVFDIGARRLCRILRVEVARDLCELAL